MGRRFGWLKIVGILALAGTLCGCTDTKAANVSPSSVNTAAATQKHPETVQFPLTLPDSGLIAEGLRSYQGRYWEDGSGDFVEDVAALMIYNPTDRMIAFAAVAVDTPEGALYFFAYRLPPKSRCLVLEFDRKTCNSEKIPDCRELTVRWGTQELSRERIDYVGLGAQLTLVNRESQTMEHVTVWYKQYVQSGDYYLGGKAFSAHLFSLQPGQQYTTRPEYYDAAHARIVGIELGG